jgi:hypothetical protein
MPDRPVEFAQAGIVSLWTGTFKSPESADAYFAEVVGAGRWEPSRFSVDFGLGYYPPWRLEINFQSSGPHSISELLIDATFAPTFADRAVAVANQKALALAQGIALLYDFDYLLKSERKERVGSLWFVGSFAFVKTRPNADLGPLESVAEEAGISVAAVAHVITTLERLAESDRRGGGPGKVTARDLCAALVREGAPARRVLREFGLLCSEDVGRAVYALIEAKLGRSAPGESEADFVGLFALPERG